MFIILTIFFAPQRYGLLACGYWLGYLNLFVFFIQWSDPREEPSRKGEKEVQERQHEKHPVPDQAPPSSNLSVCLSFKNNRQWHHHLPPQGVRGLARRASYIS